MASPSGRPAPAGDSAGATVRADNHLVDVASHTLTFFKETAAAALASLDRARPSAESVLASVNTLNADQAIRNLNAISEVREQELRVLATEPAIARVVFTEGGVTKVMFIARGTLGYATHDRSEIVSYRSPLGRLAAVQVGSERQIVTPRGVRNVAVIERAVLRPVQMPDAWDSVDSIVEGQRFGPFTIKSFRELLPALEEGDPLERLLAEDRAKSNIVEGLRRSVIAKMALRDQPLLDQFQDEIFRLPLGSRIAILGPPGTGKTTTLIKRLGLKLDAAYLDEDEAAQIQKSVAGPGGHARSWIMFTPTDLLRQYVKEAFNRENIAASDLRIQTWADTRHELARNRFGILRTGAGTGHFVMKRELKSLAPSMFSNQTAWFEDFNAWQTEAFWNDLRSSARLLTSSSDPKAAGLGTRLATIVGEFPGGQNAVAFERLEGMGEEVRAFAAMLKDETDSSIRSAITQVVARDKLLLDRLAEFVLGLADTEELDDADQDDEQERPRAHIGRDAAFEAYALAIRAQARAVASGRSVGQQSRTGQICEWLGEQKIALGDLQALGSSLQLQTSLRRFVNPLRRYFNGLPARYRRFRRQCQGKGSWYRKEGFSHSELSEIEVDAILLAILREMRAQLQTQEHWRRTRLGELPALAPMADLVRSQVAVDEATDFSAIQLACMGCFCDPSIMSFMACGDFNQRVTEWGCRSESDVHWALPGVAFRHVNITYRHSRQLNEFARTIALMSSSTTPESLLPQRVDNDGVQPVLAKNLSGNEAISKWLAARIVEIERFTRVTFPIAVLVSSEDEVVGLTESLNRALADTSLRAVACSNGNMAGQDNDVRVFDVQHIKGLEFEAVFFVGIDRLESLRPELFDKYLYVGATRAAMYLGVTTEGMISSRIEALFERFIPSWA